MKQSGVCEAACSQIDITPDFPTALIGCYRPDPVSQGVLHHLFAQALLFQRDGETFCLVAIDNLGLTVRLADTLRLSVAACLGADTAHVMLNFSHTHSAPEPTRYAQNGERYFSFLCEKIIECVENAKTNVLPCKVAWALTTADIGENRRDGCSITDNRLGALMVADANTGKPIAVVTRVVAHANVLMWQNFKISSDYFGLAREELTAFFGCPIVVLQGAAGNIKPAGVAAVGGGNLDDLHRIAGIFIAAAKRLSFALTDVYDIRMFSKNMTFHSDIPSKEEAERVANGSSGAEVQEWLKACEDLRSKGERVQSRPAEISFFKINEGCFCGLAEEIFCELALDAQIRTHNSLFFLNGYTNGCTGYLAGRAEWRKGGFEVYQSNFIYHKYEGHLMPYWEETADQIVDLVVNEWELVGSHSATYPDNTAVSSGYVRFVAPPLPQNHCGAFEE